MAERLQEADCKSIEIRGTNSSLILSGNVHFKSLNLDGGLLRLEGSKTKLTQFGDIVHADEKSVQFEEVDAANEAVPLKYRVRGYMPVFP